MNIESQKLLPENLGICKNGFRNILCEAQAIGSNQSTYFPGCGRSFVLKDPPHRHRSALRKITAALAFVPVLTGDQGPVHGREPQVPIKRNGIPPGDDADPGADTKESLQ